MQIEATFSSLTFFLMDFVWNLTRPRKWKQPSQFWPVFEWSNPTNLFNFDLFCFMVSVCNPTRPRKSKQPFQLRLVFAWFLFEIALDDANRSNLLNFDPFSKGVCMKSNYTTQIKATFSNLTCFWIVFVWNRTRPRKSKQPSKILTSFRMVFLWNPTRQRKSKQPFQIFARFWMVFVWNPTRPSKSKQPSQLSPVFEWSLSEILPDHANPINLFRFELFWNGLCMKSN